jgi:hypothetical protein
VLAAQALRREVTAAAEEAEACVAATTAATSAAAAARRAEAASAAELEVLRRDGAEAAAQAEEAAEAVRPSEIYRYALFWVVCLSEPARMEPAHMVPKERTYRILSPPGGSIPLVSSSSVFDAVSL